MDYLSCILALAQCHVRYVVQALAPGLGYEQFEERDCVLNIMCVCVCVCVCVTEGAKFFLSVLTPIF